MSPRDPDLTDLIGPYVLGACTVAEAADVRARMVVDPDFRREVESYAAVQEALLEVPAPPGTVSELDAEIKARVMDVVRQEAELFVAAGWAEPASDGPPEWRRRLSRTLASLRRPRAYAALATVLVALVVAGVAIVGLGSGGGPSEGGGTVVAGTALGSAAPDGRAEIVVEGDAGELRVSGFPAAGPGREYQVWVRTGQGDPRPTRVLFDVDRDGNGRAAIPAQAMVNTDEVLLTSEPAGGSPAPTRDPVAQVVMPA
jgi:anti-sigma-K factor RskA